MVLTALLLLGAWFLGVLGAWKVRQVIGDTHGSARRRAHGSFLHAVVF
jgi:hypothetical protein